MAPKADIEVPVLIVGGGGAGLTSSILLSRLGISSLLVTRYPTTTRLPRGHILNQRSMEVMTDIGVADDILARSTPAEHMRGIGFVSGLAGNGPADGHGRRIGFVEGWGAGYQDPDYIAASPVRSVNVSLLRTEPLLKQHAESYPETAEVRFNHELVALEQDEDGVTSTILDRGTGETYTVRSRYLLGADAGRTVGNLAGMSMGEQQKLRKLVSMYIAADLSKYLREVEDSFLIWVFNPEYPEHIQHGAVLVPLGPTRWGSESEEWLLALSRPDVDANDIPKMVQWAREALGLPDFDPKVLGIGEWFLETALADDFRKGNVFLLGDAAHRRPPSGGLGLNSAIQDAHNLCWKLAAVLDGRADSALLDTYNAERRPTNAAGVQCAVSGVVGQERMAEVLGVSTEASPEENWAALRMFWEDGPGVEDRRHKFTQWLGTRTNEYHQHHIDFGYTYDSAAIVSDGTPAPTQIDPIRLYQPSTRPGHPLPHAWVERAGKRVPLRSLIEGFHFALIAGEDGHAWVDAAIKVAEQLNVPLRAACVGMDDADYIDVRLAWIKQREISRDGAVLVRPDGFIAFRAMGRDEDPVGAISAALRQVLALDG